jgi:Crp-like helix-turn-helix domain
MNLTMSQYQLQLHLQAGANVPAHLNWRIDEGYLRISSWSEKAGPVTLGIWGPGEIVIPSLLPIKPLELQTLPATRLEEQESSDQQRESFLINQCLQSCTLLRLSRVRPAELRLFQLLVWLGERFGRVNSRGVSLSLEEMNLTHRNLAEISGLTRVTVTKAISHFRQEGYLLKYGPDELLIRQGLQQLQRQTKRGSTR